MPNLPASVLREILEHVRALRDYDPLSPDAGTPEGLRDLVRDRVDEIQAALAPHVPLDLRELLPPNLRGRKRRA